jgi:23S rRNA pseudouridine2605 synthase
VRGATRSQSPGQGASKQPDPLKTSVGYIGADSFSRQRQEAGRQRGGGPGAGRRPGGRGK